MSEKNGGDVSLTRPGKNADDASLKTGEIRSAKTQKNRRRRWRKRNKKSENGIQAKQADGDAPAENGDGVNARATPENPRKSDGTGVLGASKKSKRSRRRLGRNKANRSLESASSEAGSQNGLARGGENSEAQQNKQRGDPDHTAPDPVKRDASPLEAGAAKKAQTDTADTVPLSGNSGLSWAQLEQRAIDLLQASEDVMKLRRLGPDLFEATKRSGES